MIKLEDTIICAETEVVLKALKEELQKRGINRFAQIRNNGANVQTNCPFHKEGQEKKPSFGINGEKNKCHCFSCGWAGSIEQMISEVFGYFDEGRKGKNWLLRNFSATEIETRPDIVHLGQRIVVDKSKFKEGAKKLGLWNEQVDKFTKYEMPDYIYKRGITKNTIRKFKIGYAPEIDCLMFPVWDLNGDFAFFAKRSVRGKYFELPKDIDKPVYLANVILKGKYKTCYVTESIFNALTLWQLGKPAVALFGTGSWSQYKTLSTLPVREYILALDPDRAGRVGSERFKSFVKCKIIREVVYEQEGKDVNDLGKDFLKLKTTL